MTATAQPSHIDHVAPFFDASELLHDPAALRRGASTDGYLFLRGLVAPDLAEALRTEVLEQCARRGWLDESEPASAAFAHHDAAARATRDELLALQADVQIRPAFSALRQDPRIAGVLEAVFAATPVPGHGDVCRLAFPHDLERTTRPHQDWYYTRGSTSLWTVWVPLGDCPASLGGLAVLSGSHARGLWDHDGGEGEGKHIVVGADVLWVGGDFHSGDVLLFNALTVHGARPNVTERGIRISADFRYRPAVDQSA